MNASFLSVLPVLCYIGAGYLVFRRLADRNINDDNRPGRILALVLAAIALHGLILYQNFAATVGMNFGVFNALSLVTWLVALLLLLAMFSRPVENLGMVVFPLAAAAMLLDAGFSTEHFVSGDDYRLNLHILISILAYSIFTIAAIQAILLDYQDRHLHNKHPGGLIRALPPLQTMETLLFQLLAVGFILQSLSLLSGFAYLEDMFAQQLVHKTVLSIMAWCVFAVLLWGRWRFGWRGKTAVRAMLSGFVLLLLAYIGSKVVLEIMIAK